MKPKEPLKIATNSTNKKIYFEENGKTSEKINQSVKNVKSSDDNETTQVKPNKKKFKKNFRNQGDDLGIKWYQVHEEHNTNEQIDMKDTEVRALEDHCKKCFNEELENFKKSNIKLYAAAGVK